jgi:hypothetical protein
MACKKDWEGEIVMSGPKTLQALTGVLVVLLLNSCAEFFSSSWGESFRRDPNKVKVNSSNVYDLLDIAKGDPELSRAILDKINAYSDDTLKRAAIQAANQAAGISTLALTNIKDLVDAFNNPDQEKALREVATKIQEEIRSGDLGGISDKLNTILADKWVISSEALMNTGEIAVSVPMNDNSGNLATITVDVDEYGKGTVTITAPGGAKTNYNCVINENGTITLQDEGQYVSIGYEIHKNDENDNILTLTGLDAIPDAGLKADSNPSDPDESPLASKGKPEFKEGFIDSVSGSDLTLLAMTLILAKAEKESGTDGTLNSYLETWEYKNVETGEGLDSEEAFIAAIVNAMMKRGDDMSDLTEMIKEILGVE